MKIIKAWCLVKNNKIPENNDDPKFLCIFKTRRRAEEATMVDEFIKRVEVKIL